MKWIPALILVAAVFSKIAFARQIEASDGLLSDSYFLKFTVFTEAFCCVCLLFLSMRVARCLACCLFSALFLAAIYAEYREVSCSCFGSGVPPWWSVIIDFAVVALCMLVPEDESKSRLKMGNVVVLAITCGLCSVAAVVIWKDLSGKSSTYQFLITEDLAGQAWPLDSSKHKELALLEKGSWIVLVLNQDCKHCRDVVNSFFADPHRHQGGQRTAVFLSGGNTWRFDFDNVTLRLDESKQITWPKAEPFVAAPAVFLLREGVVVNSADGKASTEFLSKHFGEATIVSNQLD